MKKHLSELIFCLLLFSFLIPLTAKGVVIIENPLEADSFADLISNIIWFIQKIATVGIAPIMIIVAGFYFVTAAGDPEKINTAKKMILWTLVGLLIILSAGGLITFIKKIVGYTEP